MSVVVVGLNHQSAPIDLLERVAIGRSALPKALTDLASREHLAEVAVLSTCNRTEVYVRATRFHAAVQDVLEFLGARSGASPAELGDRVYTYYDDAALAHLFGVAAGVDSMIIGESEILGQVREAAAVAAREGTSGKLVARAFRYAVAAGKRARTETEISRHAASVASAAVALAERTLGTLDGRRILVLGAGEVGRGTVVALAGAGAAEVVVANRTPSRARALAARVSGHAIPLDEVPENLVACDVLLCTTAAEHVVVQRADIEEVMTRRGGRALLVVDVAVPRDVDPGVRQVFGVTLLDLDDLHRFADASLEHRRREVGKVRGIIADELDRLRLDRSAREVGPVIASLRARADEIRDAQLARFSSRLADLDPATRRAVEAFADGLVNKLLHEPTVRLKEGAGTDRGELYADALAELFDLPLPEERSPAPPAGAEGVAPAPAGAEPIGPDRVRRRPE